MAAAGTVYAKSGLRGALAYSTMDDPTLPATINMDAKTAIAHTDALYDQFHGRNHLQVYYSLRALNNCSDTLVDLAAQRAEDRQTFLEAHMNEYPQEVAGILARCGERPYVYLAKRGALSDHFLGAHSLFLDDTEKMLIETHHVKLSHSPFSNAGWRCAWRSESVAGNEDFPLRYDPALWHLATSACCHACPDNYVHGLGWRRGGPESIRSSGPNRTGLPG